MLRPQTHDSLEGPYLECLGAAVASTGAAELLLLLPITMPAAQTTRAAEQEAWGCRCAAAAHLCLLLLLQVVLPLPLLSPRQRQPAGRQHRLPAAGAWP